MKNIHEEPVNGRDLMDVCFYRPSSSPKIFAAIGVNLGYNGSQT